jgi:YidC/Oxa1 family membrane protein insertase
VVGAPFLPLAILIYWVANNLWTLGQQYVVYRRIDAEQAEKKEQNAVARQALAPRVGQKPVRPEPEPELTSEEPPVKKPGAKPVSRKPAGAATTNGVARTNGAAKNGTSAAAQNGSSGAAKNGTSGTSGAGNRGAGTTPAQRRPRKRR